MRESFLFNDENKLDNFCNILKNYRGELYHLNKSNKSGVFSLKKQLQDELREVMIRTERLSVTEDRNAMVKDFHGKS